MTLYFEKMEVKFFEDPDMYENENFFLLRGNSIRRDRGDYTLKANCKEMLVYKNCYSKKFTKYIGQFGQ